MIIKSDYDKIILELNDEELILYKFFKRTHIRISNIRSAYYRGNLLYILTNDNKYYYKNLSTMKLSQLNNLEVLVNELNKDKFIFFFPNGNTINLIFCIPMYINIIMKNICNSDGTFAYSIFMILSLILVFVIFFYNRANQKVWVYSIETHEFQRFNKHNIIINSVKLSDTKITKKNDFHGFLALISEKHKFSLPTDFKFPLSHKTAVEEIITTRSK